MSAHEPRRLIKIAHSTFLNRNVLACRGESVVLRAGNPDLRAFKLKGLALRRLQLLGAPVISNDLRHANSGVQMQLAQTALRFLNVERSFPLNSVVSIAHRSCISVNRRGHDHISNLARLAVKRFKHFIIQWWGLSLNSLVFALESRYDFSG